jgi:hypothetical protein
MAKKTEAKKKSVAGEYAETATFEHVPIDSLIPYAKNARKHSPEQVLQIAASIREFGFLAPIIAAADNTVIAGHGRLEAAKKLNLEVVPVVRACHLTKAQIRAYALVDNRLAETSSWDADMLRLELDDSLTDMPTLEGMGFEETARNLLTGSVPFDPNISDKEPEDGEENTFKLIVTLETKQEQEALFERLKELGYEKVKAN